MARKLTLLAIDDHLLPFKHCVTYYLSKPDVRLEPVMTPRADDPQAPDCLATFFYGTVLHDEGRYRMWYYAKSDNVDYGVPGHDSQQHVAYAESDDGLHWTRPNLGQAEFKGSRDNNIIALPGAKHYGACVIKEDDEPDPRRRYKMIFNSRYSGDTPIELDTSGMSKRQLSAAGGRRFRAAVSPDGINWTPCAETEIEYFIEIGSFFKHQGLYIVHAHGIVHGPGEGGSEIGRQGFAWVSPDFEHWPPCYAEAFTLPEPRDPAMRGGQRPDVHYDQVHIGVGGASFGNVAVGLLGLWHEAGWGAGGTSCDFGLLISNDGIHFREPVKGHIFLANEDSPVTPSPDGKPYPNLLCQQNGILNVGDKTLIYHGRWRNDLTHYSDIALATLPRDRWGALGLYPDEPQGYVWSAPLTVPTDGCEFILNADHPDQMRVEVSDDQFNLLPQFAGEQSGVAASPDSGLDVPVRWPGADLTTLQGQSVRFRITLEKTVAAEPRLFAVYLDSTQ